MSDGAGEDVDVEEAPAPPPRVNALSAAAIARHNQRMRPLRGIYAAVLAVLAVAVVVIVVIAYTNGEISHVTLKTVAAGPTKVALQSPASTLTRKWTSTDSTAIGTPYDDGTVVTYDTHTVRGRNALTGKQTWSYTRTDRAVCTAIQDQGVTVAVYALHGNCDELTAVSTDTGQRKWTRTLDKDGAEFDGPASYSLQPGNAMFVSATSIYAVADEDNAGLDWWTFHHSGCTINSAVVGVAGALISQTCTNEKCGDAKFCGDGKQLLLREATTGTDDKSSTNHNNPDQIVWNLRNSDLVPVLAGRQIAARDPSTGRLTLLDATNGKSKGQLDLANRSGAVATTFTSVLDADLIWSGGRTYALKADTTAFAWHADTGYLPTAISTDGSSPGNLADARLAVATSRGITQLDGADGRARHAFSVPAPAPGSLVYPFGTGFIVAGQTTTVYQ
ncbi:MAG TPA: PQQ-binding-like beta-propeller repeat protein [Jatrophihabitantaceae bacterium]|jgi:outer membrane protein assembly factor BamB|nr:PQQ-binding-like beta-propeller repeat protein [Jatrophihabitantaceae bacterium]